jgi:ADP-ribose pyrophosphatase YjhB (NUDIX family)
MNNLTIYFGTKRICFINENQYPLLQDGHMSVISSAVSEKDLKRDFNWFLKQKKCSTLIFYSATVSKAQTNFLKSYRQIEAAGGFILSSEGALFIYRNKKWDLPKGKIDKGETPRKAAIRECEEECGISKLKIKKQLPETFHFYKIKGKLVLKKTYWFEMSTVTGQKLKPQKEEGITQIKWFKKTGIEKTIKNTFPSVLDVLTHMKWN